MVTPQAHIVSPERRLRWERRIREAVQREDDARAFTAEIMRIAAAYPPEAVHMPLMDRECRFSPAQRLAWALRFTADEGELHAASEEAASHLQDALL